MEVISLWKTLNSPLTFLSAKKIPHKGDYGKILLIGGSANLGGAIMLAARACVYLAVVV